ncbi:MAG: hypothetical protein EBT78_17310, partial [Betaproteobacteria bacterium]|nr:hypothetical protein [Betaproteobacteria bacterium]
MSAIFLYPVGKKCDGWHSDADLCRGLQHHPRVHRHFGVKLHDELADFVGDSYGLSKSAASFEGGKYIVFAGVRFMAESARILARPEQEVLHPDPEAGCPMADMASLPQVNAAWDFLKSGPSTTPITYMNSTADIKA